MSTFIKHHGISIAQNGFIENEVTERLSSAQETALAAALTEAGRKFFSLRDNCLKLVVADLENAGSFKIVALMGSASGSNEVDTLETALGASINADGTYKAHTTSNYVNGNTSVTQDILDLDTQAKVAADNDIAFQTELDATQTGAGLNADGTFTADAGTTYLKTATSVKDATSKLDAALVALGTGSLTDIQTEIDKIETAAGIKADGTFDAFTASTFVNASTSLKEATSLLDTAASAIKTTADAALARTGGTMTGAINMGDLNITNVKDPAAAKDAANKQYVDSFIQGATWKNAVDVVATADVTDLTGEVTIDGVLTGSRRILLIGQTDAKENGIYVASTSGAWTRASDFDGNPDGEVKPGCIVPVSYGTVNAGFLYAVVGSTQPVVGTDDIDFTKINTVSDIVAGVGITRVGNELSINAGAGVVISNDDYVAADVYANKGLILTTDGTTASTDNAAKLAIKIDSSLEFDGTSGALKVAGAATGALTTEITAIETAVGLADDGTYVPFTTTNYLNSSTTVTGAITLLDTQAKAIQDELDATQAGAGLSAAGAYVAPTTSNYLNSSTTITGATILLDTKVKSVQDELDTTQAGAGLEADGTMAAFAGTTYLAAATTLKAGIVALDLAVDAAQDELNSVETALGSVIDATTGAYVAHTTSNYINANTSVTQDLTDLDAAIKTLADASSGSTEDLQAEVDFIEAAIGLGTDGKYVAKSGTNYINGNATINEDLVDLDAMLSTTATKAAINALVYTFESTVAATQHVITHALNTNFVDVSIWVKDADDFYKNDIVGVTINTANQVTIDLTESRNIRIIVRSAAALV